VQNSQTVALANARAAAVARQEGLAVVNLHHPTELWPPLDGVRTRRSQLAAADHNATLYDAFHQDNCFSFRTECVILSAGVLTCYLAVRLEPGDVLGIFVESKLEMVFQADVAVTSVDLPSCLFKSNLPNARLRLRVIALMEEGSLSACSGGVDVAAMHTWDECRLDGVHYEKKLNSALAQVLWNVVCN